jgi:hypothetical protein
MEKDKAPKAHWDSSSTTIFCEICMNQKGQEIGQPLSLVQRVTRI